MRVLRWGAFVTWLIVAGLAVAGFAAFSPEPVAPPAQSQTTAAGVANDRGAAAGRVVAMAFALATRSDGTPMTSLLPDQPAPRPSLVDPIADQLPETTTTHRAAASTRPTASITAPPTLSTGPAAPTVPVSQYQWPNGSRCEASWYGPGFDGRPTASGEPFDPQALTAAIHDLPFGTLVVVTRVDTGDHVTVRVNDRGPYIWDNGWERHPTRCLDLSEAAMRALDGIGHGVVDVTINY